MPRKDYFAKYIPIGPPGNVKEGDKYLCAGSEQVRTCTKTYAEYVETGEREYFLDIDLWSMPVYKAGLFICTKDIRMGDKFYEFTKNQWIDYDIVGWNLPVRGYKVLGEVSKDATWVREGDAFSEDEVEVVYSNRFGFFGKKIAKLKGPCGHFH